MLGSVMIRILEFVKELLVCDNFSEIVFNKISILTTRLVPHMPLVLTAFCSVPLKNNIFFHRTKNDSICILGSIPDGFFLLRSIVSGTIFSVIGLVITSELFVFLF